MLNTEFKEKWVSALRSGEYRQTFEVLKDADGFCCMGVAADIINPDGWVPHFNAVYAQGFLNEAYVHEYSNEDTLGQLGLTVGNKKTLMRLNDKERLSFDEIADYIETL